MGVLSWSRQWARPWFRALRERGPAGRRANAELLSGRRDRGRKHRV